MKASVSTDMIATSPMPAGPGQLPDLSFCWTLSSSPLRPISPQNVAIAMACFAFPLERSHFKRTLPEAKQVPGTRRKPQSRRERPCGSQATPRSPLHGTRPRLVRDSPGRPSQVMAEREGLDAREGYDGHQEQRADSHHLADPKAAPEPHQTPDIKRISSRAQAVNVSCGSTFLGANPHLSRHGIGVFCQASGCSGRFCKASFLRISAWQSFECGKRPPKKNNCLIWLLKAKAPVKPTSK